MSAHGAWLPHWCYEAMCVDSRLASRVRARFNVELRAVEWRGSAKGDAWQLVVPATGESWFDRGELEAAATARHGLPGSLCPVCGIWKWMPLVYGELPRIRACLGKDAPDVVASPEWFGDGMNSYRQLLVRRELAEVLADASPKDFAVWPVEELLPVER